MFQNSFVSIGDGECKHIERKCHNIVTKVKCINIRVQNLLQAKIVDRNDFSDLSNLRLDTILSSLLTVLIESTFYLEEDLLYEITNNIGLTVWYVFSLLKLFGNRDSQAEVFCKNLLNYKNRNIKQDFKEFIEYIYSFNYNF